MAETFGRDGQKILTAAWAPDAPPGCECYRRWRSCVRCGFITTTGTPEGGCAGVTVSAAPCSPAVRLPVRHRCPLLRQRDTAWSGYRVHLTETCDTDRPEVVIHVATTIAPVQDGELTEQIHDDLADAGPGPVRTCRRCRLHRPGPDRTCPPGPRHHTAGPGGARPQPPGQKRWRLRQVRLRRGLGQRAGHLRSRAGQPELGATAHQRP